MGDSMTLQALIADDEAYLRQALRSQLATLWPELEICSECENGLEALRMINDLEPDIVFLDIRMPGLSGMEVAKQVQGDCHIVFVTAYDEFAVEAFERHAVDYLLKPVVEERLQATIQRLQQKNTKTGLVDVSTAQWHVAINEIAAVLQQKQDKALQWIRASRGDEVTLVHINDIIYFQSGDKYTSVVTAEHEQLIRTPLKKLEEQLDVAIFWRIHRRVIVNTHFIQTAKRLLDGRYELHLRHIDNLLMVSRAHAHLFKRM